MRKLHSSQDAIWLAQPADRWIDAFPIGNGRIGGMVFGGTARERIGLNHESLWRGVTRDRTTAPRYQHLPEIREKLLSGQWIDGAELARQHLSSGERRVQPYQPVGDLILHTPGHEDFGDYRRELRLDTGIVEISYASGGASFRREVFASAEHGVIVLRLTADTPAAITTSLELTRQVDPACAVRPWSSVSGLGFHGRFEEGIEFAVEARVAAGGGSVEPGGGASVRVTGADELLVVLAITVGSGRSEHPDQVPLDFRTLRDAHVTEHGALFSRVALQVGGEESLLVDERIRRLRDGKDDPGLMALYFQFGRYLLMASSRKCDQPANLQGIWCEELKPPWESDFHHDINLEMNYWPAEVCNLSECAEPLFAYLRRAVPEGAKAARNLFGCRGIFMPLQTDVWDRAAPESNLYGVWTGCAAWLSEHLWWRWEFSRDAEFLREEAYPFLKAVAEFYEDFLVPDAQGRLVTAPSQSPENRFVGGSFPVSICVGSTIDILLVREVLSRCLEASRILGVDEDKHPVWKRILEGLPPFQTGCHGQLQEWLEDFEEAEPGHRHVSHVIGVFPGEQMTPDSLPEFYRAARVSLERREAAGGCASGWGRAWAAALCARFYDGAWAYRHLTHLLADFTTRSLLDLYPVYTHYETDTRLRVYPPEVFQIDGNLGGTAAIAEMLLQSHGGVIRPLPALPPSWREGSVSGLRARGGFEVDIHWRDSRPTEVRLMSNRGGTCRVVWPESPFSLTGLGKEVRAIREGECLVFDTEPGQEFTLRATD